MNPEEKPYNPSWIDRLNRWIASLPINLWLFHLLLALLLILIQVLFLWLDAGLHAREILPVIVFNSLAVPFLLVLLYILDQQSVSALEAMKPVLDMTGQEYEKYHYMFLNMPFFPPLAAGLVLMIIVILTPTVTIDPLRYAVLDHTPTFSLVYHIIDKMSAFLFGVVLYHLVRHLRLVNSIYDHHVRINLFDLGPLQGLSRVTASTIIGLLVFIYAWMLINPELLTDPFLLVLFIIFTIIPISVFAWPLWGLHRMIDVEKKNRLHEIDLRFEAVAQQFNQHLDQGDLDAVESLNGIIISLDTQRNRIDDIPTWPWRAETARLVLTAIALPLLMMVLQLFVSRALPG